MGEAAFHLGLVVTYALAALGAGWLLGAVWGLAVRCTRWWWGRQARMSECWRRAQGEGTEERS